MGKNSEFNNVKVTNESQMRIGEFSFTQKSESSSYPDNSSRVSRDEANDNIVTNNPNKAPEQKERKKENKNEDTNRDRKDQNKQNESNQSSSENGGSSSSSSSSASASSGSSAASSSAAGASGAVVSATVIAVTAVSAVAGINVVTSANARANMVEFGVTETEVYYGLELFTDKEDTSDYFIYIDNPSYSSSKKLLKGPDEVMSSDWPDFDPSVDGWYNGGSFTNLTPATRYTVTVKDNGISGKILYESAFMTAAKPNYSFNEIRFVEPNYMDKIFYVELDFFDPTLEVFSDFNLTLSFNDNTLEYPLEVTTEKQLIEFDDSIYIDLTNAYFSYELTYLERGEEQTTSGTFDFTEGGTMHSAVEGFTVGPNANFENGTFEYTIDYVDDFHILNRGHLTLLNESGGYVKEFEVEFNEPGIPQTLSVMEDGEATVDLAGGPYTWMFSYYLGDNLAQFNSEEAFTFVDTSGSSRFYGIEFDNPNFIDRTCDLRLDYTEALEGTFKEFDIAISYDGVTHEYQLDNVTEFQPIDLSEFEDVDLNVATFTYTLTYNQGGTPGSLEGSFTFEGEAKSEMNGVTFGRYANFEDYTFEVTLDMYNDFGYFDDFSLDIIDYKTKTTLTTLPLQTTTEAQTFSGKGSEGVIVDVIHGEFTYFLHYTEQGEEAGFEPSSGYSVMFLDSQTPAPELTASISTKADFDTNIIHVTLSTNGDPYNLITDIKLIFTPVDKMPLTAITLQPIYDTVQDVTIPTNLSYDSEFDWSLQYFRNGTVTTNEQRIQFVESTYGVTNFVSDFKNYYYADADLGNHNLIPFKIEYYDTHDSYKDFTLDINGTEYTLSKFRSGAWQFVDIGEAVPFTMNIKLYANFNNTSIERELVLEKTESLAGEGSSPIIIGAWMNGNEAIDSKIDLTYLYFVNRRTDISSITITVANHEDPTETVTFSTSISAVSYDPVSYTMDFNDSIDSNPWLSTGLVDIRLTYVVRSTGEEVTLVVASAFDIDFIS